jgi:hypothetical protein
MPNDCWNHVTIYAPTDTIRRLVNAKERFVELVSGPPTGVPDHEYYGSDRFYDWAIDEEGQEALQFRFTSAWAPPIGLFQRMLKELGLDFMKVTWSVEDGIAGVWVGERTTKEGADDGFIMQSMHWDEGCIEEKEHRWRN